MKMSKGFVPIVAMIYGAVLLLASLTGYLGYRAYKLDKDNHILGATTSTTYPIPQTPEPTSTSKPVAIKTVDPDPVEPCTSTHSGDSIKVKRSECKNKYIDCQLGNTWKVLTKEECTKQQGSGGSKYTGYTNPASNYPPCTIYYPALGYSQTYSYTSPEQCQVWKNNVSATTTSLYTPIPVAPTPDAAYQDLLNQHTEACKQAVTEWNTQKEQFYATEYNNFSSSYEAVQELERRRQIYQQDLYSAGCTQTISI